MDFFIDHHIAPAMALIGMLIDMLGALFLAYELLGEKEERGEETKLRMLARGISYGIAGMFLGLLGFALGFSAALLFHFSIIVVYGYSNTFGELLGYTIGWGFAVALGYTLSSPKVRLTKPKPPMRRIQWFKRVDKFAIWLVLGLTYWSVGWSTVTFNSKNILWRKIALSIGFGLLAAFTLGLLLKKRVEPKIDTGLSQGQESDKVDHRIDGIPELSSIQLTQFKARTKRFRIIAGFGIGLVMGVLFWLGGYITLGFNFVQGFTSGFVVGLIGGTINGLVFGILVRRFLVQDVHKTSSVQPKMDKFGVKAGIIVTTTTAFFYTLVIWLFFGGNLIVLLLAGSFIGFIGGFGGGYVLCITPLLEYKLRGKQLGYLGLSLLAVGLVLQSLQYLIVVFNLPVK